MGHNTLMGKIIENFLLWGYRLIRAGYYLVALYGLFLLVSWWHDSKPPINFGPSSVLPQQVHRGDTVVIHQDITKTRDCIGKVNRYLEGPCGFIPLIESSPVLPVGNRDLVFTVNVPKNALPGACQFISRHQYFCNPLDFIFNRKIYIANPVKFTVLP